VSPVTAAAVHEAINTDVRLARHVAHIKISSRRRTLGMSMKPGDDGITIHVPADATPAEVVTLLGRNRDRIGALLTKSHQHAPDRVVRELVNGSGFLWLGYSSRLRLVNHPSQTVRHVNDDGSTAGGARWLELDRNAVQQGARPLIDWYTREGTAWLAGEVPQWWARMAPHRPIPRVRADSIGRRRWGVYDGALHEIRIAWQTLQLQPRLVRHILVHELVHATRPAGKPHGPEFWRRFEAATPGARQDQRDLAEAGRHIWMGDIA
jgi:predicted metal-dependent hydrolase